MKSQTPPHTRAREKSATLYRIPGKEPQREPLHYPYCGLDIYLLNGFSRAVIDGEETVTVEDMDGLWKAIAIHLVARKKMLTPAELKFLRQQLSMTQKELGQYLRVTDQTVARWEKGETELPGPADVAIRTAFLASPAAQPEGRELSDHLLEIMKTLTEMDDTDDKLTFRMQKDVWTDNAA